MDDKEKIERLEKIVRNLCSVILDDHCDWTWQKWADPLHEFLKETDPKNTEEKHEINE